MVQNTIPSSEVAKVILQAVTSDNPDFRYVIGKDAAMIIEARKNEITIMVRKVERRRN
jgi:hypothetical protein